MPLYVYEFVNPDGGGGEQFERLEPLSAPPLTAHPETGAPVRRVFAAPNAPRAWTDAHGKAKTSDGNLERLGFTKYVKGSGGYQKQFGKGPDAVRKPPQG